jgi:hypothetical protein
MEEASPSIFNIDVEVEVTCETMCCSNSENHNPECIISTCIRIKTQKVQFQMLSLILK